MIDIAKLRENPEAVKENIKKKFQDHKLPLVDKAVEYDKKLREAITKGSELRAEKNKISKSIGALMREGKREEAEEAKAKVKSINEQLPKLEEEEKEYNEKLTEVMYQIPNFIDPSVPVGKDDSENVEVQRFGEAKVPDFEIPHHADIIARVNGMDKESAGRTSGEGFYYLLGDVARLHEAMLAYARDYMIDRGFTYAIPPFMIRSSVVNGVMSFEEM
ncbi:MAG TPA: serine--tRNA ligase, partial [Kandleria vitulina]|nr:serine--tRNA ligase [Kandleria vitulina]